MFTRADEQVMAETGLIPPDRLRALRHALLANARDARDASRNCEDQDSQGAAALRGRKLAYMDAAHMVQHIIDGQALHPRRFSSERRRNQAAGLRRRQRRQAI